MKKQIIRIAAVGFLTVAVTMAVGALIGSVSLYDDARAQTKSNGGYMGVSLQELDNELRESYGYRGTDGVLISDLDSGGPADEAGLRRGDIIIRINGRAMNSTSEVAQRVGGSDPGAKMKVSVWRNNREKSVQVVLAARPEFESRNRRRIVIEGDGEDGKWQWVSPDIDIDLDELENLRDHIWVMGSGRGLLGVRTQELNRDLGSYFKVPDGRGVLVTEVLAETPAEEAGMRAGDVILQVNGQNVTDTDELREELREREDDEVAIVVMREGSRYTLTAKIESHEGHGFSYRFGPRGDRHFGGHYNRYENWQSPRIEVHEFDGDMDELREELREMQRELKEMFRELHEREDDK